ncbi:hypothetical protein TW95_gp0805 [Pandoravirus inopinatum]|uniref:Uncharacterized protein n=1 Tax=Pandoravirus inopinatum TaxID=1605721 RepID=A0A0B5J1W0_9VIRU|nr:hypothetical protein TW95_gp0805 [Pandoravirus inopinatum]AJF97539.1 hypothetical protein [Pandoravirus inopinatum]
MPLTPDGGRPLCPDCENNLYFRCTSTCIIFVYCDDCSSIWLCPHATGWGDVASVQALREHFRQAGDDRPLDAIFGSSTWATRTQIMKDVIWADTINTVASIYHE